MGQQDLATKPPSSPNYLLAYPAPFILLITINRANRMNSLPWAAHWEAHDLLEWFDNEPSLRVCVVTGAGPKAFCAGQDLIEQNELVKLRMQGHRPGDGKMPPVSMMKHPLTGFMGISRRGQQGKKPIIAAVNGFAMGGGFEIVLGCDMTVASPTATFALPEASRGLYAAAGGLARLARHAGLPIASEVALAGRILSAEEATNYAIINRVSMSPQSVVSEAIDLASRVANLSPDSVLVTRSGIWESYERGSVERASQVTEEMYGKKLREGENIGIGLAAFAAKQQPQWVPSKL